MARSALPARAHALRMRSAVVGIGLVSGNMILLRQLGKAKLT
jgi:hypothetical protein